jgi:hypothetical protein
MGDVSSSTRSAVSSSIINAYPASLSLLLLLLLITRSALLIIIFKLVNPVPCYARDPPPSGGVRGTACSKTTGQAVMFRHN